MMSKNNRFFFIILIFSLLLLSCIDIFNSEKNNSNDNTNNNIIKIDPKIYIETLKTEFQLDELFNLIIKINESVKDITAINVEIFYDKTKLMLISKFEYSPLFEYETVFYNENENIIGISVSMKNNKTVSGDGVITGIKFKPIIVGKTNIKINSYNIYKTLDEKILVDYSSNIEIEIK